MHLLQAMAADWQEHFYQLMDWPDGTFDQITYYVEVFPILISLLWSTFAIASLCKRLFLPAPCETIPGYSVIIPFYGECDGALKTARSLSGVHPAPAEILLIDDGSPNAPKPRELQAVHEIPHARLIRYEQNAGKAHALNVGLRHTSAEIIICMDADTLAVSRDWSRMLSLFAREPRLAAITGKIWPMAVKRLVHYFQCLDYLAVIGLVKSAESQWGCLLTVSGAWVAYRRSALREINDFNESTSAEDIDLSWRLQLAGWRAGYEPSWTASVEMAPSWKSLWRQRKRWSSGFGHVVREHLLGKGVSRRASNFPIIFISFLTVMWAAASVAITVCTAVDMTNDYIQGEPLFDDEFFSRTLYFYVICTALFYIQLGISTIIDRRKWSSYLPLLLLAPFYPLYYLIISFTTFVVGFPLGFLRYDSGRWSRTVRFDEINAEISSPLP
jgi:biofilm PGA synthesis N-glycosyltransferase PgaC